MGHVFNQALGIFHASLFADVDDFKTCAGLQPGSSPLRYLNSIKSPQETGQKLLQVFHAAFEYDHYSVGGVGSVVTQLVKAENGYKRDGQRVLDSRVITPYYSFLERDDRVKEFVGHIPHYYNGAMHLDEVYKTKSPDGTKVYLIKPDERAKRFFDVDRSTNIYSYSNQNTNFELRSVYFASAVASFIAHYKGKKTAKRADLLQCQSYMLATAAALLKEVYNPRLNELGRRLPKITNIVHNLNYDQGVFSRTQVLRDVGLNRHGKVNATKELLTHTDCAFMISKAMKKDALHPARSFGLFSHMQVLKRQHKLKTIIHGVSSEQYDPTNREKFGDLALRPCETIATWKWRIKKHLKALGIIDDEKKPLFLYVGRFSHEKGINQLAYAKESILKGGGSFVVMGRAVSDKSSKKIIDHLKRCVTQEKDFCVIDNDQNQKRFGHLIRASADFMIIPSYEEACGLVAYESYCMGAQVITSWNQGLKDVVTCFNHSPDGKKFGTGYSYFSPLTIEIKVKRFLRNTLISRVINFIASLIFKIFHEGKNIKACCHDVLKKWKTMKPSDRQKIQARILRSAHHNDWSSPSKVGQYVGVYQKLCSK